MNSPTAIVYEIKSHHLRFHPHLIAQKWGKLSVWSKTSILKHEFKPRGSMMRFDFGLSESRMIGMDLKGMVQLHCSGPPCLETYQKIGRPRFGIYFTDGVKHTTKNQVRFILPKNATKWNILAHKKVHLKMNKSFYNLPSMGARWT